ncbi:MAG: hypothetical protein L6R39_005702, partial [Caloplaca ligustica]
MVSTLRKRKAAAMGAGVQDDDVPGHGERFRSKIFVVSVGAGRKEFTVHEASLAKSPVFAAMCQEGFQESRERCIYLPEDDPDSFGAVIEYLYTGNFRIEHDSPTSGFTRESSLIELATIYVAAEKYHLDALKTLVVDEFSLRLVPGKPEDWLASAEVIYQAIPD